MKTTHQPGERKMEGWPLFAVILILACILDGGEGRLDKDVKALNVRLEIPRYPKLGDPVVLGCKYDMGTDPLYTVKWYRGTKEFYRFTPKESPSGKMFKLPGLDVDLFQSNATHLYLSRVDLSMSGRYSCEVTTDAPEFITEVKTEQFTVIAFPTSKPVISQLKPRYSVGDIIDVNCSSYRSKPAANLTWFINSTPAPISAVFAEKPMRERENLESSKINLRFKLQPNHFIHSRMALKCTAKIFERYAQSSDETIYEDDRPKISSVVDNSSSQSNNNDNRLRGDRSDGSHPSRFQLIRIGALFTVQVQCELIHLLLLALILLV